jgi:hypothetical protein
MPRTIAVRSVGWSNVNPCDAGGKGHPVVRMRAAIVA